MSAADAAQPFPPGTVLAGKYEVLDVLGEGGMGVVLLAHNADLDGRVALKVPRLEILANPSAVARFEREAKVAFKLKSEHVARVHAVGRLETGQPYIEMEYLEGEDLAQILHRRGPLPVPQVVELLIQVCDALAEAHAQGVVHRDLKPANLFCTRRRDGSSVVKVLDFGISKVERSGQLPSASMTQGGVPMGSPLYMSPEQTKSARDVDARSDLWAVGVILYELLSGRPPFVADSLMGLGLQIVGASPVPLRELRSDVPGELATVVHRCLEKDRAARFEDVGALVRALAPFAPPGARYLVDRVVGVTDEVAATQTGLLDTSSSSQLDDVFSGRASPADDTPPRTADPGDFLRKESPSNTLVAEPTSAIVDALASRTPLPFDPSSREGTRVEADERQRSAQPKSDTLSALGSSSFSKVRHGAPRALMVGGVLGALLLGGAFWRLASSEQPPHAAHSTDVSTETTFAVRQGVSPTEVQGPIAAPSNTQDVSLAEDVAPPTSPVTAPSSQAPLSPTVSSSPKTSAEPTKPTPAPTSIGSAAPSRSVRPAAPAPSPAPGAKAISCAPPYTVTPRGRKVFKPECF